MDVEFDILNTEWDNGIPDVTVWCRTFNHRDYIEDALLGFINQKTNYKIEVIILDDASTDGTSDIIRKYALDYPELIKALIARSNFFNNPNKAYIVKKIQQDYVRGRYVAFCEGDDCWLDRNKLQMQLEYMDKNLDCTLTVHNSIRIDYSNNCSIRVFDEVDEDKDLTVDDILWYRTRMDTASMVVRREYLQMDDIFCNRGIGDWTRQLYCAAKGTVHYFDRVMSLYRYRTKDSWSYNRNIDVYRNVSYILRIIDFFCDYDLYTQRTYEKELINMGKYCRDVLTDIYINNSDSFTSYLEKTIQESPSTQKIIPELWRCIEFNILINQKDALLHDYISGVNNNRRIIIWGTGKGGKKLAKYLERINVDYLGFCVSELKEATFQGRKVYELKEIANSEDIIVYVGIYSVPWEELRVVLLNNEIRHYYFPYLFHYNVGESLINT